MAQGRRGRNRRAGLTRARSKSPHVPLMVQNVRLRREPVEPRARPSTGSGRADGLQSYNFGNALRSHATHLCNCVVKGRKGRFPAHFLSFPLVPVGHWAGHGAEWGPKEEFWRRFERYWRSGGRVWGSKVRGVGHWDGCGGPGWRVGIGAMAVTGYAKRVRVRWFGRESAWMHRQDNGGESGFTGSTGRVGFGFGGCCILIVCFVQLYRIEQEVES